MFNRAKPQFQLVETSEVRGLEPLTKEMQESLSTLPLHPAFQYLLKRFRKQASLLEHKLKFDRHKELRDVEFLQAGVFWLRWLENDLASATRTPRTAPVPAGPADSEALARIESALEILQ